MLTLQHHSPSRGWVTLTPFDVADATEVQRGAASISAVTGMQWRVLGQDGRVLSIYRRQRWQSVAEAEVAADSMWMREAGADAQTVPGR